MLSTSAQKVQETLQALGFQIQVVELPTSTRSSAEAAQAVGCQVGQIAKSLVFRTRDTARPVLVITSDANRVNKARLGKYSASQSKKPMPISSASALAL